MKNKFIKYSRYFLYSFPLQLLLLQFKKHPFFLFFWLMLFASVLYLFGTSYGVPYLLLDPEYLANVNFLSFFIVGFAMAAFIMTWNISTYMLNSFRFEFLASTNLPFVQFCLNNSIIPLAFTIIYIVQIVKFQHIEGLIETSKIVWNIVGLVLGNLTMMLTTTVYFILFNRSVETFIHKLSDAARKSLLLQKIHFEKLKTAATKRRNQWHIETFLNFPYHIKQVRKVDFYDEKLVNKVLNQHHRDAFILQITLILTMIAFGFFMENKYLRLPAGASLFLLFTVVFVVFSFITFWFRGWRTVAVIAIVLIVNTLSTYDIIIHKNALYGLDYSSDKLDYNNETVNDALSKNVVNADIAQTEKILNNWLTKVKTKYHEEKPKLIFINTAGGGLKATYWTFHVLQELQKQTNSKLFDHTFLLTGASGGMIGAAYFRELYLRNKKHEPIDYLDKSYLDDAGNDMLNGITTSIALNDIFFPIQKFEYKEQTYYKDRGYMFNREVNENTHYFMDKLLTDYKKPEQKALIPMMILSATIINDQRYLFFSPQPISYLIKPYIQNTKGYLKDLSTDAVEYNQFFKNKGAANLKFVDALRANATYPYIMPAVYLPTKPAVKAMDAGIRENSGLAVSTRFYSVFKDWMDSCTSGVIFISIRVDNKLREFDNNEKESMINSFLSPLGSILNNFILLQDYNSDVSLAYLENSSRTDISVLNFNYDQTNKRKKASMSWHLTALEKQDIQDAFKQDNNQQMLQKLKVMLK
ncbi:MAG: patatin-like phospholipase family protein [Chitinophagales bacterium]